VTKKRILFVGEDLDLWHQLQGEAPPAAQDWDLAFAKTGLHALASLSQSPCDAVVADWQLPGGMNGGQFLDEVMQRSPSTLRFIRSSLADQQAAMKCVGTAHQYLVKPCDAGTVCQALERAFSLEAWLPNESVRALIAQMKQLPSPPALYFKIVAALRSPDASLDTVGALLSQDVTLSAKLLQLVNSAVFGLRMQVANVSEAIGYLGFETTKSLVLVAHTYSYFDKVNSSRFSIHALWRHSLLTGRMAQEIAREESNDDAVQSEAYTAGMLHDFGKLLLAANLPEPFNKALALARDEKIQLWEAEQRVVGANHAELGACLLGIWGLPVRIVEAAALHHFPIRFLSKEFCPLTAVHAANCLQHELAGAPKDGKEPPAPEMPLATLDASYLADLGLADHVEKWRELLLEKAA
jgi:HD-like signal output (HDOD) protein